MHDALFTAFDDEESWGVAHRILAPRLSPGAVAEWCGEMGALAGELVDKLLGQTDGGEEDGVLLVDELNRLNLEATTLTLFGKRLGCIAAPDAHPMLAAMEASTSEAMKRPSRPGVVNRLLFGGKFASAIRVMREAYAADLVAYRKANPTERKDDLLAAMLEGTDPQTGKRLSDSQVVDEIVSMPIGSSTAPCLLASAVYFLIKNPGCLATARAELDQVLGPWDGSSSSSATMTTTTPQQQLTAAQLGRLPYLEGVVREALRLSCAAPGFNIEPIPRPGSGDKGGTASSPAPVLLGGGKYCVAHDQAMIVVLAGVNRDPAVFAPDPLAFRPERMMGESFAALPGAVKKWFGNGKRECIGKHWAWQFSMVTLAVLVRACDFEAMDPGWELDGKQDGWFNLRPVGFRVRVSPRKG